MEQQQRGFLNAFQLKVIMAILMVLDHVYYLFSAESLEWGHYLARVVAPVFTFLMTEGMLHTRNRGRYVGRMLGFGFAMLAGTLLLKRSLGLLSVQGEPAEVAVLILNEMQTFTIFISLGISAALIVVIDRIREGTYRIPAIFGLLALTLAATLFEGAYLLPLMAIIFYYLRERPFIMGLVFVAVFGTKYGEMYFSYGYFPSQFYMIFALIPIFCYNGERGPKGAFSKYFFYVFYPLHIWVLYGIRSMLFG